MKVSSNDVRDDDFPNWKLAKLSVRDLTLWLCCVAAKCKTCSLKECFPGQTSQGKLDTINSCRWCAYVAQYVIEQLCPQHTIMLKRSYVLLIYPLNFPFFSAITWERCHFTKVKNTKGSVKLFGCW